MVFIKLEEAYDRVTSEVLWKCLKKKEVSIPYIRVIKDMYDEVKISVWMINDFLVDIGLHQAISFHYCNEQTNWRDPKRGTMVYFILFTNDIILIDETRDGVNNKLER